MNRKGFTLVEVLAVIAIMAVILIIAIPNVIDSLNEGKKKNFGNEVTTIQNSAKTMFNKDKGVGTIKYSIVEGQREAFYCQNMQDEECKNDALLTNNEGFAYKVELDIEGIVQCLYITNGRFYYVCNTKEECSRYDEDRIIDIANGGEVPEGCNAKVTSLATTTPNLTEPEPEPSDPTPPPTPDPTPETDPVVEQPEPTFTITYHNVNGATNNNPTSFKPSMTINLNDATKSGSSFGGWYLDASFTGEKITKISNYQSNIDLYAKWSNMYTVSFDCNGGSGNIASQTGTVGSKFTLTTSTCTRKGYTQNGWVDQKNVSWTTSNATNWTWTEAYNYDPVLKAVWKPNTYTISFNCNGGSGNIASQTGTVGSKFTLTTSTCTRTGYNQSGWVDQNNVSWTAANTNNWIWSENYDYNPQLKAVWGGESYTVSFNCGAGSNPPKSQMGIYGSKFTLSSSVCTRNKYQQNGWKDQKGVTWTSSNTNNWTWDLNYSPVLTAQYTACNRWVLTNPQYHNHEHLQLQLFEFYRNCQKQTGWVFTTGYHWENPDDYLQYTDAAQYADDPNDRWYYLDKTTGYMINGWQYLDGGNGSYNWYFFALCDSDSQKDLSNITRCGCMWRNKVRTEGSRQYHLAKNGACTDCQNSWFYVYDNTNYHWYYADSNAIPSKGWKKINYNGTNSWFYFDNSGIMLTGWQKINNSWYYLGTNGVMQTGWVKLSGYWYYLGSDGRMVTGTQTINNQTYVFDSNGRCTSGSGC